MYHMIDDLTSHNFMKSPLSAYKTWNFFFYIENFHDKSEKTCYGWNILPCSLGEK